MQVKKHEGESASSLVYRFTKKVQQSGILREAKKRRFYHRAPNKCAKKLSALYRYQKKLDLDRAKKMGIILETKR